MEPTTHTEAAEPMLHNPEIWIAVAFVVFVALFLKFVWPVIAKSLDERSSKIRDQLEQANRLRAEAEALLASYQAEREAKEKEAEEIILSAKRDAQALRDRAASDLKLALDRRSQQAVEKIARSEQEATAFIRTQMIDVATETARELVRTQLDTQEDPAIAKAISAISSQIH